MDDVGERLDPLLHGRQSNYMTSAMEDSGTMQSLTFLSQAAAWTLQRVLVLRTVSNFDREPPESTAAESSGANFLPATIPHTFQLGSGTIGW